MTWVLLLILVGGLTTAGFGLRARLLHTRARERLRTVTEPQLEPVSAPVTETVRPVLQRRPWLPFVVGAAAGAALVMWSPLAVTLCLALASVAGTVVWLLESFWAGRLATQLEQQLADTLDLMISALRAGSGLLDGLDYAANEMREPLRRPLTNLVERIRLGEDPKESFAHFSAQVPLDTFRLFSASLSVHWEAGGSLASTLAAVGRTIRDRNEITRRVRAQTTQARASVLGILGIVYLIGVGSYVANPGRVLGFAETAVGTFMVAGVIFLQAFGLVWIAQLSAVESTT